MRQIVQEQLNRLNHILGQTNSESDTLLNGKLGLVYYYYNSYEATSNPDYRNRGDELLEGIFKNINSGYPKLIGSSFSTGGAGLGYVVNSLVKDRLIEFDIEEGLRELEEFLYHTASYQIEEDFIDYLHGALGVIHYFTTRGNSPEIRRYLDDLIKKLYSRAIRSDAGYWFSNYVLKLEEKENINFGLAHGLSGILLILLNAYPLSQHKDMIRTVVLQGIRFIRKYKMDVDFSNEEYSFFPFIVNKDADEITAPNRLGWCYGDLNEILVFYRAGNLFKEKELIDLADVLGAQTLLRKTPQATLVTNSCFCHGASGLAQIYRKLCQERALEMYEKGYEYWIEQTVLLAEQELNGGKYIGKELELLEGLLGVGFVLLSYVSPKELTWSKSLLL